MTGKGCRRKGQVGERALANELGDLLGLTLKRRVRNHEGDSDVDGLIGWSAEVKNCSEPRVATWWAQTVQQCKNGDAPVLFYKLPRREFKAVVSLSLMFGGSVSEGLTYTTEMSLAAFAMLYREGLK